MVLGGGGGVASPAPASTPDVGSPAVEVPDPVALPAKTSEKDKEAAAPLSERAEMLAGTKATEEGGGAKEVLGTEAFWGDLKDFLVQRLRDEGEGERLLGVFREAAARS